MNMTETLPICAFCGCVIWDAKEGQTCCSGCKELVLDVAVALNKPFDGD